MRAPTARCVPHIVNITHNAWTTDQDGGRKVASTVIQNQVPCFVQPGQARTVMETSDEGGLRRVTEIVPGKVYFVSDVGLKTNDLIAWLDTTNIIHNYIVLGYQQPCSSGSLWVADVEERL